MKEPTVTVKIANELGLSDEEYQDIISIMGRVPNYTELSMYSVMWSEHCSYKNSIKWLKTLPCKGDHLLAEAGEENAGLVDIGDGLACAFKIESHNHPSAIEPYQGAATGVGGIHRDIFTMGARPIAALNSLRFGDLKSKKTKHLLKGVVKGIGDYGNSFGVPTVGGEVYFENCYEHNPLVNAMSIGIVEKGKVVSAISKGAGNPVYIVGSATGKDGIHGATFASEDITEDSADKLPSVQVGDPFQEKLLLEASLEAIETGAIVGMQDMGAAGITCSSCEMSEKGAHGMHIYLDRVPTRQKNMAPFEMLLSESQERMLVVVEKGREKEIEAVFDKWDLHCKIIGEVTEGEKIRFFMQDEVVAEVPAPSLVLGGGAPVYDREYEEPPYFAENKKFKINDIPEPENLKDIARQISQSPNIASKRWVYQQYDSMVGINTVTTNSPSDAAMIRIKGHKKSLLASVDCNARYVQNDPFTGAMIAVCESARNISCSGGIPVAVTNCLNFGNPYDKHVFWQFVNTIKGMGAACEKFHTPVTGGNVSFYNQNPEGGAVYPTPAIGMLGVMEEVKLHTTLDFKDEGDLIYMIGPDAEDIASSHYLSKILGITASPAPAFDLETEFQVQKAIQNIIRKQLVKSAHDVSDGGLYVALLESAMAGNKGFEIKTADDKRKDAFLFGEAQSRIVVSLNAGLENEFKQELTRLNIQFIKLGQVTGSEISIDDDSYGMIEDWKSKYDHALENALFEN
jgi:phosphoribosylformylglycinamidine synthase subunit PurL